MTCRHLPSLLPLVLACLLSFLKTINAQASVFLCDGPSCVESFTFSCEELTMQYDFYDGTCCMSLNDDSDSGGCILTVGERSSDSSDYDKERGCNRQSRTFPCATSDNFGEYSCLGNEYISYSGNLTATCPESDHPIPATSLNEVKPDLTMTLESVLSWSKATADQWLLLTEQHTVSFFVANPVLGKDDVLTYISPYAASTQVGDDEVTLNYLQFTSWRGGIANPIAFAFETDAGKEDYIKLLQTSNNTELASVTDFTLSLINETAWQEIYQQQQTEQEQEEDDEPPGGAGAGITTAHETDPPPPADPIDEPDGPGGAGGAVAATHDTAAEGEAETDTDNGVDVDSGEDEEEAAPATPVASETETTSTAPTGTSPSGISALRLLLMVASSLLVGIFMTY